MAKRPYGRRSIELNASRCVNRTRDMSATVRLRAWRDQAQLKAFKDAAWQPPSIHNSRFWTQRSMVGRKTLLPGNARRHLIRLCRREEAEETLDRCGEKRESPHRPRYAGGISACHRQGSVALSHGLAGGKKEIDSDRINGIAFPQMKAFKSSMGKKMESCRGRFGSRRREQSRMAAG